MSHSHEIIDAPLTGEKQRVARKTTLMSVGVNVVLMFCQIIVGLFAHSQALVADGIHSLSDIISDFIVLFANRHAHSGPDSDHHYGHSRYENLASLFLGLLLLVVGVGMLWRAISSLIFVDARPALHFSALWVALVVLVAKESLFRYMLSEAKKVRSSLLVVNAWHARSDAASSLVVALGIIGSLAGYHDLDSIAAVVVGVLICKMGIAFAWTAIQDLSDRAIDETIAMEIEKKLLLVPGVQAVHELRTRKMGDAAVVDVHLLVDSHISVSEGHFIAELAQARIMSDHRVLDALVHIDPEDDANAETILDYSTRDVLSEQMRAFCAQYNAQITRLALHYLHTGLEADLTLTRSDEMIDIPFHDLKQQLNLKRLNIVYSLAKIN